ncbi:MAG: hypothetical protein AB7U30_09585 [Sulfuricellaceae bacterium]|jgi:hypothetical protein
MQKADRIGHAFVLAGNYLDSRQCRNGGFCFYRTEYLEEPNLYDTYYALAAYRLLERPVPEREKAAAYLEGQRARSSQPDFLYYLGCSLRLLDMEAADREFLDDVAGLRLSIPGSGTAFSDWLAAAIKTARLKKSFTRLDPQPEAVRFLGSCRREGGYGSKPNLPDTFRALCLLAELGRLPEDRESARFVDEMQTPSLGFRCTGDSLFTHLGVLYAGVFSCALLRIPVRYPHRALDFVLASQGGHGGFAPAPESLGDLRTHCMSLRLITHLLAGQAKGAGG